jgi:uncharacterized protein
MAKAPIPGRVKTRLCPPCTPTEAAAIAEAALRDTLSAALACGHPVVLALEGPCGKWLPNGVDLVAQSNGNFNCRLAAAWTHLPAGGVQIGMDTPQAGSALLARSLDAVAESGAAFGPAADGGWWLIGMVRPHPAMFAGVAMSSPTTGEAQIQQMHALGFRPKVMPTLTDIDAWADAKEVAREIPRSRTAVMVAKVSERLEATGG